MMRPAYSCTASTQWWGQFTLVQHPHNDEASLLLYSIHTMMRPAYPCTASTQWWGQLTSTASTQWWGQLTCTASTQWWGQLTLVQHPHNDEASLPLYSIHTMMRPAYPCTASTQWWGHTGRWWSASGGVRSTPQPAPLLFDAKQNHWQNVQHANLIKSIK